MFAPVSIWGVLVGAISAMIVGAIWYGPLFGKEWSKLTGVSDKAMKAVRPKVMPIIVVVSLLSAYALSLVTVYLHSYLHTTGHSTGWVVAGLEASLVAGIGFAMTAVFAHGVFHEDKKLTWINATNRIVTFVIMGLIVGAFLN